MTHSDLRSVNTIPDRAEALYNMGFEPIPIAPSKKFPTLKNWQKMPLPFDPWPKNHGIGLRTGHIVAIDFDIYDQGIIDFILGCIDFECLIRTGQRPKTLIAVI